MNIIDLRKKLHQNAELSGKEIKTVKIIKEFINNATYSFEIAKTGIAFVYDSKIPGKTIMIRCDLDALPIIEENLFCYASKTNASHLCGHDGHMAIVAGLSKKLNIKKGKVILLFQPEEETGQGARLVLNDKNMIDVDYIFALHNIPKFNKNEIIIKEGPFASASGGMIIKLKGKTSHAGQPENGISPTLAVSEILEKITNLKNEFPKGTFATIIHTKIGEIAFGTSPGEAVVMATLRSYTNENYINLKNEAINISNNIAKKHDLKIDISWVEEFSSVNNDSDCVKIIENAAKTNNLNINYIEEPFNWSEDFGYFTDKYKGAMFGLGSGKECPNLHNPDYDFPDEIIETGIEMFNKIINECLENEK